MRLPETVQELVDRWLDDRASDEDIAALNVHMRDRAVADAVSAQMLVHSYLIEDGSRVTESFRRRRRPAPRRRNAPRRRSRPYPQLIVVATAVLALIGVIYFASTHRNQPWAQWHSNADGIAEVVPDQRITATAGGFVSFANGSRATFSSGSVFTVQRRNQGTRLSMETGSVNCAITPQPTGQRFTLETPLALVDVIGTSFQVSHDNSGSLVVVTEGSVETTDKRDGSRLALGAGERRHVLADLATPPPDAQSPAIPSPWLELRNVNGEIQCSQPWQTHNAPPQATDGILAFDGNNNLVISDVPQMGAYTAVFLLRPRHGKMRLFNLGNGPYDAHSFIMLHLGGGASVFIKDTDTGGKPLETERRIDGLQPNAWNLLSATVSGHTISMRLNGQPAQMEWVKNNCSFEDQPRAHLLIGGRVFDDGRYFRGELAEVMVFTTALSTEDLAATEQAIRERHPDKL